MGTPKPTQQELCSFIKAASRTLRGAKNLALTYADRDEALRAVTAQTEIAQETVNFVKPFASATTKKSIKKLQHEIDELKSNFAELYDSTPLILQTLE
jgi:hypothetical protein